MFLADSPPSMISTSAGSSVRARARIVAVEAKARGVLVTEEIEVAIVGREQEKPALSYTMLMMYQGA